MTIFSLHKRLIAKWIMMITASIACANIAVASTWSPTALVNTESFNIIDEGDSTTDVYIQFGDTLSEQILYERAFNRFNFTDDVNIEGNLAASGSLTVNSDQSGNAIIIFGNSALDQAITYSEANDRFEFSSGATFGGEINVNELKIPGLINCDSVDTDADGNFVCGTDATGSGGTVAQTGAYLSITAAENSNGFTTVQNMFADALYPGGTLDFDANVSQNATFDQSNGRFTVSTDGTYMILLNAIVVSTINGTTEHSVDIRVNGASVYDHGFSTHSVVDPTEASAHIILNLNTGDYVEFYMNPTGGQTINLQDGTTASLVTMGSSSQSLTESAADARFVNTSGDTMTGALIIDNDTDTVSIEIDSEATSQPGLRIDTVNGGSSPHILLGSGGTFDVSLFRSAADTLRTSDAFIIDSSLLVAGGRASIASDGTAIFNLLNEPINFRIAGDSDANAFFVHGASNQVGIGTSSPQAKLDVAGTVSGSNLVVSNMKNCDFLSTNADGTVQCEQASSGTIFASYNDVSGGLNINTAVAVPIPWDNEIREDIGFVHDETILNTRIELTDIGWYKASYSIAFEDLNNQRKNIRCGIHMNGSLTPLAQSISYGYARTTATGGGSSPYANASATVLFETTAVDEYYEVRCNGVGSNTNPSTTVANESWTVVERPASDTIIGAGAGGGNETLDDAYDNDTGERTVTVDNGDISFDLQGTNNFIVDLQGAGGVGIGTENPTADLDVRGSVSGSTLTVSSQKSCSTFLITDSDGTVTCSQTGASSLAPHFVSVTPDTLLASSTGTIVITGNNLDYETQVSIPGWAGSIDAVRYNSATEMEVDVTIGATLAFYDIVLSNGGKDSTGYAINLGSGALEVTDSVWTDLRTGGTTLTTLTSRNNYALGTQDESNAGVTRDAVNGMSNNGATSIWGHWLRFDDLGWTRGDGSTLSMVFRNSGSAWMLGIGSDANDPVSGSQWNQMECMMYLQNGTTIWGFYGNNGTPGSTWNQAGAQAITSGAIYKVIFENDATSGANNVSLYLLPSADIADWDDTATLVTQWTVTNTAAQTNLFPVGVMSNNATNQILGIKVE